MRYYAESFVQQIRQSAAYRANLWFSLAAEAIPLLGVLLYFLGVMPEAGTLNGYSQKDMLTYYVLGLLLVAWIPTVWWEVGENIRQGTLNSYLLRPKSYFGYFLSCQGAVSALYTAMSVVFVGALTLLFPGSLRPPPNVFCGAGFLVSSLLGFLLAYQTGYLICLSAFWVEDVTGLLSVTYLLQSVACGQLFPLDFLPRWAYEAIRWSPFPYWFFFPLKIYMGLSKGEILNGLGVTLLWLGITGGFIRVVWNAGIKRYDARGG